MAKSRIDSWKQAKEHEITLPSGQKVKIALPDLPGMMAAGDVPNALVEVVLEANPTAAPDVGKKVTIEDVRKRDEFNRYLVSITVVDPAGLTPEDVKELPVEDRAHIIEFANRERDIDAAGVHIGGLQNLDSFREARTPW